MKAAHAHTVSSPSEISREAPREIPCQISSAPPGTTPARDPDPEFTRQNPMRAAIIMAGGFGERFWPLSRAERPKQLLAPGGGASSLLELAAHRIAPLISSTRTYVIATQDLIAKIQSLCLGIPAQNLLAEPGMRDTTGCVAFGAAHLLAQNPGRPETILMAVLTSDHQIGDDSLFRAAALSALEAAERHDVLAIIGIPPTRPETGFGYIEVPAGAEPIFGESDQPAVYPIARFREKPSRRAARKLIRSGHCYWNSGMFFWRLSAFLGETERANPELAQAIYAMAEAMGRDDPQRVASIFESIPNLPIDVTLIERARNLVMARGSFPWDDIGSWDALYRALPKDEQGNAVVGDPLLIDSSDCIVYNEPGGAMRDVALVGVKGLAVVVTPDGVLVVPKDRAQEVRHAARELRKRRKSPL